MGEQHMLTQVVEEVCPSAVMKHVSHANYVVQDPEMRPLITEVKDTLLEYARLHFKSRSPAEAMAMKHVKERALLDQILPPKVCPAWLLCVQECVVVSFKMHNAKT